MMFWVRHYYSPMLFSRSDVAGRTNFGMLRDILGRELTDTSIRSQRNIQLVFQAFLKLNSKFNGTLTETSHRCFPDEYFTCAAKCKVRDPEGLIL